MRLFIFIVGTVALAVGNGFFAHQIFGHPIATAWSVFSGFIYGFFGARWIVKGWRI